MTTDDDPLWVRGPSRDVPAPRTAPEQPTEPEPCTDPRCTTVTGTDPRRGWIGDPDDDTPRACLTCRPHLRPEEHA